jgi:rhomboid protease GluP
VPQQGDPPLISLKSLPAVLWIVLLACCLPELVLQGVDHGLFGSARWRPLAYQNAGFWAGLLRNWQPNYPAQPFTMFVTYAFLHAGFVHLLGNMVMLLVVGPVVIARFGARGFALIYAGSILGGGLSFGLLSASPSPMIGASGAISGLIGAVIVAQFSQGSGSQRYVVTLVQIGGLVALNLVSWWLEGGVLAWQTHLGGCLAGIGLGGLLLAIGERRASQNRP